MHSLFERLNLLIPLTAIATLLLLVTGCPGPGEAQPEQAQADRLPKLRFHKPGDFPAAVTRLEEIRTVILSDQPLPPAKVFRVVESIHGSGAGAHSHYHLERETNDEDGGHDHAHGHSHDEENSEVTHDVQVDLVTEMVDIVKWMPDIAADSDMEKGSWDTVKQESSGLHDRLVESLAQADGPDAQRQSLQEMDDRVAAYLVTMRSVADQVEAADSTQPKTTGD
ncbi:MAG: hypothetical protein MK108_15570 [Mariniblastus sp.]|nr:hypothetical protein [Mariniblastus sp.]